LRRKESAGKARTLQIISVSTKLKNIAVTMEKAGVGVKAGHGVKGTPRCCGDGQ